MESDRAYYQSIDAIQQFQRTSETQPRVSPKRNFVDLADRRTPYYRNRSSHAKGASCDSRNGSGNDFT